VQGDNLRGIYDKRYLSDLDDQLKINEEQVNELRLIIRRELHGILLNALFVTIIVLVLCLFAYTVIFDVGNELLDRLRPFLPTGGVFSALAIIEIFFKLTQKTNIVKKLKLLVRRQLSAIEAARRELNGGENGAAR
jgi:hypothetical protein